MILLGIGAGIAFNPVLLAAMSDVAPEESGLASGVVNTAFMMGGALGLAVLASLAASRTDSLRAAGDGAARRARPAATTSPSSSAPLSPSPAAALGAALLRTRCREPAPRRSRDPGGRLKEQDRRQRVPDPGRCRGGPGGGFHRGGKGGWTMQFFNEEAGDVQVRTAVSRPSLPCCSVAALHLRALRPPRGRR